ncbi:hypothetical protein GCM10022252_75370 [Streptosporangium oxazolinicum]|uniref:DUF4326 domain-containing protein n=1 Tax=Streptosporangium oxazolinicum TaxID=909287 RepID=A0ABP8BKV9_9ACTN
MTAQAVTPNAYSPYATADPTQRHVFASFFGADPLPNVLALAGCEEFAVVPSEPLTDTDPDNPHAGLCLDCVAAMRGKLRRAEGKVTDCRFCNMGTTHDGLCALCRQEAHDEWWPIRPVSDTVPAGAVPQRIVKPRPGDVPADVRLPDGARMVDDSTVFANPHTTEWAIDSEITVDEDDARSYVVDVYREWLTAPYADTEWPHLAEQRRKILAQLPALKGRSLVCSCEADSPCCADVLLELANPRPQPRHRDLYSTIDIGEETLRWCEKPDCDRLVRQGVKNCCTACAVAADGRYEIHAHSDGCDQRWEQRRSHLPRLGS